jgi:hypothetical protein
MIDVTKVLRPEERAQLDMFDGAAGAAERWYR